MMKSGTQVAYIPSHANGEISHPGVEYGFITSIGKNIFVRYWRKGFEGQELRTTCNSEATPPEYLVEHNSVEQSIVDNILLEII